MEHPVLEYVDARFVNRKILRIDSVLPVITILHDRCQPGRPVCQLLDLNRFFNHDAVRAQPATGPNTKILDFTIADIADIRLRVHGQRHLLPKLQLEFCHIEKSSGRGGVIRERTRKIAGVSFAPKPVHHQVDELHQRVVIKLLDQQLIQLFERALKLRMIVARLDEVSLSAIGLADLHERNLFLEEVGQRKALRLAFCVRHLNAKCYAEVVTFSGVECQREHRMELKFARRRLDVAPVTTNVKQIDKWQRGQLLNVLLECLSAGAGGERWSTFFPRVTHQTEAVVFYRSGRLRGDEDRVPTGILLDAKWTLVQAIGYLRSRSEVIALPVMRGNFLRCCAWQRTRNTQSGSFFDKTTPAHDWTLSVESKSAPGSFRGRE